MANDLTVPSVGEAIALEDGRPNATWWRFFKSLGDQFNTSSRALGDATSGLSTKATKTQPWSDGIIIEFPDDGDYAFPGWFRGEKITSVITECASGTCTLTAKIGDVPLGGSANAVSTMRQTEAHESANQAADGDDLVLTVSSNSECARMSVTLRGTIELA